MEQPPILYINSVQELLNKLNNIAFPQTDVYEASAIPKVLEKFSDTLINMKNQLVSYKASFSRMRIRGFNDVVKNLDKVISFIDEIYKLLRKAIRLQPRSEGFNQAVFNFQRLAGELKSLIVETKNQLEVLKAV